VFGRPIGLPRMRLNQATPRLRSEHELVDVESPLPAKARLVADARTRVQIRPKRSLDRSDDIGSVGQKAARTMIGRVRVLGSLFALIVLSGCQAALPSSGEPLAGSWGGEHVALELSREGGTLEYDCAAGSIDEAVRPDSSGRFSVRGTHTPGHGGPERVGEEARALPAEYEGFVRGRRISLSVRVPASRLELGPFTLDRGAAPVIMRCL
jgi:hypothetical protein